MRRCIHSGYTWSYRAKFSQYLPSWWNDFEDVYFLDSLHGWTATGNAFSRDGGRSWQRQTNVGACSTIVFADKLCGWSSDDFAVQGTTDGGKSWHYQLERSGVTTLLIVDDSTIYAIGSQSFWRADLRDFCDTIVSSHLETESSMFPLQVSTLGKELVIHLGNGLSSIGLVVTVADVLGKIVYRHEFSDYTNPNKVLLNVPDIQAGTYLVHISSPAFSVASKILVSE